MELNGKVALITGGGTGIGRATAERLAALGAGCAINYSRSASEAEDTVKSIESAGGKAFAIRADVSMEQEVRDMVARVIDEFGRLDVLINNAGRTSFVELDDLDGVTDEIWDSIVDVNLKGTFKVTRACAAELKKNKGTVVNVSSIAGSIGRGSSIPYAVSKAGIDNMTRCLARVLAPEVRVNAVAPGIVDTRWVAGRTEHVRISTEGTLLKRVCHADDVAELILGLITNAGFVTGQIVTIDGGFSL